MLNHVMLLLPMLSLPCQSAPVSFTGLVSVRPGVALAPGVLEGGRPRSRALLVALHGGSFSDSDPLHLAERCREALDAAARSEGLRLLVPVAPVPAEALPETGERAPASAPLPGDGTPRVAPARVSPARVSPARTASEGYQVPWLLPEGEDLVLALIDAEIKARRADSTRIYLAGHGAGATGALMFAARHPERVTAVAAWAGTPPPLWDARRRVVGLMDNPVAALESVPVYLWTARDDVLLDRAALQLFTRGLAVQRPAPRLLIDDESGGHGYGAAGPGPGLRFLHAQRRKEVPRQPVPASH